MERNQHIYIKLETESSSVQSVYDTQYSFIEKLELSSMSQWKCDSLC